MNVMTVRLMAQSAPAVQSAVVPISALTVKVKPISTPRASPKCSRSKARGVVRASLRLGTYRLRSHAIYEAAIKIATPVASK